MKHTLPIHEVSTTLQSMLENMLPGEEVALTKGGETLAIIKRQSTPAKCRRAGSAKHIPHWMSDDFDAPLEDFKDYMS